MKHSKHPQNRSTRLKPLPLMLMLAGLCLMGSLLAGQSAREDDDFAYIRELYYREGDNLNEVEAELDSFSNRYPNSEYGQYVRYLRGNIALRRGDFEQSSGIYRELLEQELHPDVLPDVYLNYAISNYYLQDLAMGLSLLKDLEEVATHPWYLYQVNVWRGRIKAMQELWLSAEDEYRKALDYDPREVLFDYFQALLALQKDDEAQAILDTLSVASPDHGKYHGAWLDQLLTEAQYDAFDEYISGLDSLVTSTPPFILLRIRKELDQENYAAARALLPKLTTTSETATYYRAVLLHHDGFSTEADALFRSLLSSREGDLAMLSYLERLKILHNTDPGSATRQLEKYLESPRARRGDAFNLLGQFRFAAGDHQQALSHFIEASNYLLTRPTEELNQILSARCCYNLGQYELCSGICNRYLNNHPKGRYRDVALYYAGKSSVSPDDARIARLNYEKLLREHPDSPWVPLAGPELAEVYFTAAEYPQAEELYLSILSAGKGDPALYLRLAQTYYYQDKYAEAGDVLNNYLDPEADFEAALLKASIAFSGKDFHGALESYTRAENLAETSDQKNEALSYRAYTLYYLKRYDEASDLFLALSQGSHNADIYLYQAAKSAAAGKNWVRALEIHDRWLDEFPDSEYYLSVLADIANINFNLGRFSESLNDWLNILRRFTAVTFVSEEELPLLAEVFTGIETSSRKLRGSEHIDLIAGMIDTFKSDYIKFELEYILVKLYANAELWEDLLLEASQLRASFALPRQRQNEFDGLLLRSLIMLNRMDEADSLASQIMATDPSKEILIQWAELAELNGDEDLALDRYQRAFELHSEADVWLRLVELSAGSGWRDFDSIWTLGSEFQADYPLTQLSQIGYLFDYGRVTEAKAVADSLLDTQTDPRVRAGAETWLGRILFTEGDYDNARRSFNKIRLLYQDLPDVQSEACYYLILSLAKLGETLEARLALDEFSHLLDEKQSQDILMMLENRR